MKDRFSRGIRWTALSNGPSASSHSAPQSDQTHQPGSKTTQPDSHIVTLTGLDPLVSESEISRLSPKNIEDNVAERLQVDSWRFGTSVAAITAGVTAIINLVLGAVTFSTGQTAANRWSSTLVQLFTGSCDKTALLNTWTHLAINVVSTCLLAGSNFTMQCLMAPSRADVDRAHASAQWVDIGLPSIRNLRHVSRLRGFLWFLLVFTSLPLHLLFNSAFFSSIGDNSYDVVIANAGFLEGDAFNLADSPTLPTLQPASEVARRLQERYLRAESTFKRIETQQCIDAYANDLITDRRSVIVVTNDEYIPERNDSVRLALEATFVSTTSRGVYQWICAENADTVSFMVLEAQDALQSCSEQISERIIRGQDWRPANFTAEYCLSEEIPGQCSFYANVAILWIIFTCNLIKLVVILYTRFSQIIDKPLMTIGDAVASFITEPDFTTEPLGPTSERQMKQLDKARACGNMFDAAFWQRKSTEHSSTSRQWSTPSHPRKPASHGFHLAATASVLRWTFTITYYLLCILTVGILLHFAIQKVPGNTSFAALYSRGLGKIDPKLVVTGWNIEDMSADRGVVSSVLVANAPQLALSIWYFAVNSLLTLLATSVEWSRFSLSWVTKHSPRTLRTSSPRGDQRRTYFLQLPYRFAVPLIVISALIHWLISQSIFLAVISNYGPQGELVLGFGTASVGYSCIGMIFVIMASSVLMLGLISFGLFRMEPGIPIVASSSAAISSCCHVNWPEGMFGGLDDKRLGQGAREEMVKRPLVWGELVSDNERLVFDQHPYEGSNRWPRYGFVSATGFDWRDKVR